jgi:hypothetical protein
MANKKGLTPIDLVPRKYTLLVLSAVVFILMVIMGFSHYNTNRKVERTPTFEEEITQLDTQTEGDEISAIEADLVNTNLDDIDKELQDILREFE